jgi:uncharacterized RDD family membrane protein YckC
MLHEVITSEKVPFTYRIAGPGSRMLAALADAGVILVLLLAGVLVGMVLDLARPGLGSGILFLWLFLLLFGYFLLFEWLWLGQTPGKRLLGIRVIQWQGTSVTFSQAAVRNFLRVVDLLPAAYGVGFVVMACNPQGRRLGDLAANTLVVHVEGRPTPFRALHGQLTDAEKAREALFRQSVERLDRRQQQTLLELCLRRDQLRVRTRSRLFTTLAAFFKERSGLTPAEYESDEKFVIHLATALKTGGGGGEALVAALRPRLPGRGQKVRDVQ